MRKSGAVAFLLSSAAYAHPTVAMHMSETDKNHYVIISDGAGDDYLDCYNDRSVGSLRKEIRLLRYSDGGWKENHRDARERY